MGDHTKLIQVETSTAIRLDNLERRVSALEAGSRDTLGDWVTMNGKWLIGAGIVLVLALMGWTATDIKSLVG